MLITYDPATLSVLHAIYYAHFSVIEFQRSQPNTIEYTGADIPVEDILLTKDATGTIIVGRLQQFSSDLVAPIGATVNQSLVFKPIPIGTAISINGASLGVMDSTGELDFTPQNGGQYVITLTLIGYKQKDITFEVVA